MIDACCDTMRFFGRDHYQGVPEAEMPDALIEFHRDAGKAFLRTGRGEFDTYIFYCPWCGARIGKHPSELTGNSEPAV